MKAYIEPNFFGQTQEITFVQHGIGETKILEIYHPQGEPWTYEWDDLPEAVRVSSPSLELTTEMAIALRDALNAAPLPMSGSAMTDKYQRHLEGTLEREQVRVDQLIANLLQPPAIRYPEPI